MLAVIAATKNICIVKNHLIARNCVKNLNPCPSPRVIHLLSKKAGSVVITIWITLVVSVDK